jgi:transposase
MLHSFAKLEPHLPIISTIEETDVITLVAFVDSKSATCPQCHEVSNRAHSHYTKVIDDLPIQNKAIRMYLKTRK